MRCVLIDDEPLAIEILENYIERLDNKEIVGKFTNSVKALEFLSRHPVDLVFLDIQMPNLTGIDLVKSIKNLPQFIFTTAYPEYALEGFDLNATDYLVKPIPFSRFLQAIGKAEDYYRLQENTTRVANDFIFVRSEYENVRIATQKITYIEGLKDYIKIYTENSPKAILTLMSFKDILERLNHTNFLRVHRSFIVNISQIDSLQKTRIIIGEKYIPIGETYKQKVLESLGI